MGFDVVHLNLHKTFGTPHGGGGGLRSRRRQKGTCAFLPVPLAEFDGERYRLDYDRPLSIGRVRSFNGNFGVILRAYAYIRTMGPDGLRKVSENAVLNANYLMHRLKGHFDLPYERTCMHEFVLSYGRHRETGVRTLDIARGCWISASIRPPCISLSS